MPKSKHGVAAISSALILSLISSSTHAEKTSYFEMSLEELMDIEVTIASKSEEKSFTSSSAISVLTNEDIKRSGATSIAEALKLLPGVMVSESGGQFAVSIRGFHDTLTDKLLVLMDGRTVYTPLFSGVFWDEVDTYFEDIDRIEVVRGPGATLWGANAVNGVINIITKNTKDTVGSSGHVLAGSYDNGEVSYRKGVEINEDEHFRVYAKYFDRNHTNNQKDDTDYYDGVNSGRGGFRYDNQISDNENLKIQGDVFSNRIDYFAFLRDVKDTNQATGGNILTKWQKKHDADNSIEVQAYFDYTDRANAELGDEKYTYDIEIQRNTKINKNELIVGAGYRYVDDDLDNTTYITGEPSERETDLINAFIQNKYPLYKDKLFVIAGSKFSHNDYTHYEYQPSLRFSFLPNEDHTFWASVSRAVRIPNRKENDAEILFEKNFVRNDNVVSEELLAYEIGYRTKAIENVYLDVAAFYNEYEELSTIEMVGGTLQDPILQYYNNGDGHTYGFETSINWEVQENWKLTANHSYIEMNIENGQHILGNVYYENKTPRNIFSLRSLANFGKKWEWDNTYYYRSSLDLDSDESKNIRSYHGLTTKLTYKPSDTKEISFVAKDLIDPVHNEDTSTSSELSELERRFYVKYTTRF